MKFEGVDYYNVDELLSDEEKMTRNMVRDFLEKEIEPLVVSAFHQEEPLNTRELAPKMGELGIIGPVITKEYGAVGAN